MCRMVAGSPNGEGGKCPIAEKPSDNILQNREHAKGERMDSEQNGLLSIHTLGGLNIQLDSQPLSGLASRKAEALVVYLAANPRPHPREVLAELLWDELPQRRAMTNLRVALTSLRKQLDGFLAVSREQLAFQPAAGAWLDTHAFEQLLHAPAEPEGLISPEIAENTQQALQLYNGEFLQGFFLKGASGFEDWATRERERLHRLARNGLYELSTFALNTAAPKAALAHATRLLELDPLMEAAHRQMMMVLAHAGQREDALTHFERCRALLEAELGVEPAAETTALFEQIQAGDLPSLPQPVRVLGREPRQVGESPYRGLAAFLEADAPFFFGREAFTDRLLRAIRERALVTVLVGPSGSGKSSAVFAGLLPKLREDGKWLVVAYRPGPNPFQALAGGLMAQLAPGLEQTETMMQTRKLGEALEAGDLRLDDVAGRLLKEQPAGTRLLLVGDQFEELFTLCHDTTLRREFLNELLAAAEAAQNERTPRLVLLQTLRADFMGQALAHRPFADALEEASVMLGPMTRGELRAAIEQPAEKQGAAFETGLVERILEDVGSEPGQLPLLEFALTLLWDRLDHGWLTHAAYDEIGQVSGALAQYAEEVYDELDETEETQAARVFVQLVQPGEGTEDTRRLATWEDVGEENWGLVQHLADRRLVVTGQDAEGRKTVEVVHEALIRGWGRLVEWMEADRAFRTWQEGLRAAIRNWEASDQDEGGLLRGAPLVQAESWFEERSGDLSPVEGEYIQTGIALRQRREAEREGRRRRVIYGLGIGLLVALVLSVFAFSQRSAAEDQTRLATSRELSLEALNLLEADPELAILLALEALSTQHTLEAENALHQALQAHRVLYTLTGHSAAVNAVVFGPDGASVISGSDDGTIKVWDVEAGTEIRTLDEHTGPVTKLEFSPGGEVFASASMDGSVMIRDPISGEVQHTLAGHSGGVLSIEFSPDGTRFATGSEDRTAKVWDTVDWENRVTITGTNEIVTSVLLDHEGGLVTGKADGTIMFWDAETGELGWDAPFKFASQIYEQLVSTEWNYFFTVAQSAGGETDVVIQGVGTLVYSLEGHGDRVKWAILSEDEQWIATASRDKTAKIWRVEDGELVMTLGGHADDVNGIALNAERTLAATASSDGTVKIWNIGATREVFTFEYNAGPGGFRRIRFNPAGDRLLTVVNTDEGLIEVEGPEGATTAPSNRSIPIIQLWDVANGQEIFTLQDPHEEFVCCAIFSPDGTQIVTASDDATVKFWDTNSGELIRTLEGHKGWVNNIQFSEDGRLFVTASSDNSARIWDLETGEVLLEVHHDHWIYRLALSPDKRFLVTGSFDAVNKIWEVSSGQEIKSMIEPINNIGMGDELSFSPDGKYLVTANEDGVLKIWEVATWDLTHSFNAHNSGFWGLSYSQDGQRLVTGGRDGTVRIFDTATWEQLILIQAHDDWITDVDFSPDGAYFASASFDRTAKVFVLSLDKLVELARTRVTRSLTTEECQTYLHLDECPAND